MGNKILIIVGTGMLRRPVAQKLKADGFEVVTFTRNPEVARLKMPINSEFAHSDVRDESSVLRAMEGCYGVHINLQGDMKKDPY